MFAADVARETQMLSAQVEDVLGELVTRGLVTADGFSGLRQLIHERKSSMTARAKRRRVGLVRKRNVSGGTGRWSLWRPGPAAIDGAADETIVEQWAWQLLRRWGVVFRDLLVREPGAPSWYHLSQVYRRLEARGEIRGGRFIAGVGGEQFGTADTVQQLRALREDTSARELIAISAADPLNLVGILTSHDRIPSTASNRIVYVDGAPVAALKSGEITWLAKVADDVALSVAAALTPLGALGRLQHEANPAVSNEAIPAAAQQVGSEPDINAADDEGPSDEPPPQQAPRARRHSPSGIPRPMIS
jgi:ATP-dependent Lhr-like helicase